VGAFGTTGQRCTATSRILLQKGIAERFTTELSPARRSLLSAMGSKLRSK